MSEIEYPQHAQAVARYELQKAGAEIERLHAEIERLNSQYAKLERGKNEYIEGQYNRITELEAAGGELCRNAHRIEAWLGEYYPAYSRNYPPVWREFLASADAWDAVTGKDNEENKP